MQSVLDDIIPVLEEAKEDLLGKEKEKLVSEHEEEVAEEEKAKDEE